MLQDVAQAHGLTRAEEVVAAWRGRLKAGAGLVVAWGEEVGEAVLVRTGDSGEKFRAELLSSLVQGAETKTS